MSTHHVSRPRALARGLAAAAIAVIPAAPAAAQTPEQAAAQNLQLAAELCLRHGPGTPQNIVPAYRAAGFELSPDPSVASAWQATAPGVYAYLYPVPGETICNVQSQLVPMALARAIGAATAERLYPGAATPGTPDDPANAPPGPCQGLTFWNTRPVITITYAQAGNSGDCVLDGTSSIFIRM